MSFDEPCQESITQLPPLGRALSPQEQRARDGMCPPATERPCLRRPRHRFAAGRPNDSVNTTGGRRVPARATANRNGQR
jgi:hypothetical protein